MPESVFDVVSTLEYGAARVLLEGKQGGGRLWSAAFTARVIVRERVRVAAGGTASKEGNSTNGEETFKRMRSRPGGACCL